LTEMNDSTAPEGVQRVHRFLDDRVETIET
jgi:hypothetical protein